MRYVEFEQQEKLIDSSFKFEEESRKLLNYYGEEEKYIEVSCDTMSLGELFTECFSKLELEPKRKVSNVYFVLGKPGSGMLELETLYVGKSTQCINLAAQYGLTHISIGDLLREEIKLESKIGVELADRVKNGRLVATVNKVS
jgi:adenylate kinase family enzyme